jgi:hypothetical protein
MSESKREYIKFITPRVIVKYPRLLKPDTGPKSKPTPPKYSVKGIFTPGKGTFTVGKTQMSYEEIVALLEEARDAEFVKVMAEAKAKKNGKLVKLLNEKGCQDVFYALVDEDGAETGEVQIGPKTAAEFKDKETGLIEKKPPPSMVDAKGKKIKKIPAVGGGSEMKLAVSATPYFVAATGAVGMTYYLNGTQLLKLEEYEGGGLGFVAEDGYDGSEDGDAEFSDEAADTGTASESTAKAGDDF